MIWCLPERRSLIPLIYADTKGSIMNSTEKRNVVMAQVNYQYGNNIFVPYAVGSLQAYAETVPEVRENFHFQEPLFLRKDPALVVESMNKPSVVGLSCYLWNWEYNKSLARAVRAKFPNCLIVFGGAQVPNDSKDFFVEHPYVDILVHGEGEFTFVSILLESLCEYPDYTSIAGLSIRGQNLSTVKTAPSVRIMDLSVLPSPYLVGVFDFLLGSSFLLNASQETTRGCPYACTYCDWGGDSYKKVVRVSEQRLLDEFEWFGKNKVEYLFNCDANYGISKVDLAHTVSMLEIRARHGGYPQKFRMCTAKNSDDRIFEITKLLSDAGMNKGATLSFQSMDDTTLETIKRKNIKMDKFSELMDRYRAAGIATYTELIMGMPGETYESSKKGIDILFEEQADTVNLYVYACTLLPNSEMNNPFYSRLNGIRSVRMPLLLAHSTPEAELSEYQNVIVGTNSMSPDDWQRTYVYYWAIQCMHCLGLTPQIAILFHKMFGVKYSDFYEKLIDHFAHKTTSLIGADIALVKNVVSQTVNGGRLDLVIPKFGETCWPLEEATFLNFVTNKESFYKEIRSYIDEFALSLSILVEKEILDDLILYQSSLVKDPNIAEVSVSLRYDLHDYFSRVRDPEATIKNTPSKLIVRGDRNFDGDLETYAREVVWFGRKGGRFHHTCVVAERV
jgi:radical SAM superfamily enzyme YgiQ (UPF0313 family)